MTQKNAIEYLIASAKNMPKKIAFSDESEKISFEELWKSAQALATTLTATETGINRPVAVLSRRNVGTITAFMGVLACGCYYVPIDNKMPTKRMEQILHQISPEVLLYNDEDKETAETIAFNGEKISLSNGLNSTPQTELLAKKRSRVLDIDPAYIIFTSGSTGTPKGIVISHQSVIDFTEWMSDFCGFTSQDIFGNQAPFHFDLSVKDIYQTLKLGATTEIIPQKNYVFPPLVLEYLEEKKVTALNWANSAFHFVANSGALAKFAPKTIRSVVLGGEALRAKQLNLWRKSLPNTTYINLYGPTEVTVDCTAFRICRDFRDDEAIPIGYPCRNKEIILLDENLQQAPPNAPGEICVRGIGLAKGYYADEEKTKNAFIQNPLNSNYPDIIYRTGDIGFYNDRGELCFSSRKDGQIKHMGYRIELGEVETALNSLATVETAVCLFDTARDKIICIYVGSGSKNDIAKAMRSIVPKYMIPNIYHQLEKMPLNRNGKIDRVHLKENYVPQTNS